MSKKRKLNDYIKNEDGSISIILKDNLIATIDAEDLIKVRNFTVTIKKNGKYIYPTIYKNVKNYEGNYTTKTIYLGKVIIGDTNKTLKHIDKNVFNCRKSNLRLSSGI